MENMDDYFTLAELAKEFDVDKSDIRFCEEKGLISPRVIKLSRRVYNKYDRARLKMIMHCVLIGYSQEQVVKLIGMPDIRLNRDEQIRNGIEYGEKKLAELEKRKLELSFHKRTGIMSEINMMREYLEEIKSIEPEPIQKRETKPQVQAEKKEKKIPEPSKAIKPKPEKKPVPKPAGRIPVYIAVVVLLLVIAGYFYYQAGQKKNHTIRLAKKEQAEPGTPRVYRELIPIDNTDNQPNLTEQTPEIPVTAEVPPDSLKEKSAFYPVETEAEQTVKTGSGGKPIKPEKSLEKPTSSEKQATVASGGVTKVGKTQKAALTRPDKIASVSKEVSSTLQKKKASDKQIKHVSKAGLKGNGLKGNIDIKKPAFPKPQPVSEGKVTQKFSEKKEPISATVSPVPTEKKTAAVIPDTKKTPLPKAEVRETPKSETVPNAALTLGTPSISALNKKTVVPKSQEVPEEKVKQKVSENGPISATTPAVPADEESTAVAPEVEKEPLSEAKDKKIPKPEPAVTGALLPDDVSPISEKKEVAEEQPDVETATSVPTGEKLTVASSETKKEPVLEAEIKKATQNETGAQAEVTAGTSSTVVLSQKAVGQNVQQPSAGKVEEKPDLKTPTVKGRLVEHKGEPSIAAASESEKEQKLIAAKEKTVEKEISVDRLKSFLDDYCKTYENQDLEKFFAFFTPDATENNRPVRELIPDYRKNKEDIDSLEYRIKLIAYALQADTGNIMIQGRFFMRELLHGGTSKNNSGDISMELVEHGDSFLVKQINFNPSVMDGQ